MLAICPVETSVRLFLKNAQLLLSIQCFPYEHKEKKVVLGKDAAREDQLEKKAERSKIWSVLPLLMMV